MPHLVLNRVRPKSRKRASFSRHLDPLVTTHSQPWGNARSLRHSCHLVGYQTFDFDRSSGPKAKGEGKYKGRAPTARAKSGDTKRLAAEDMTREAIAAQLKIGVASVYRVLKAA